MISSDFKKKLIFMSLTFQDIKDNYLLVQWKKEKYKMSSADPKRNQEKHKLS